MFTTLKTVALAGSLACGGAYGAHTYLKHHHSHAQIPDANDPTAQVDQTDQTEQPNQQYQYNQPPEDDARQQTRLENRIADRIADHLATWAENRVETWLTRRGDNHYRNQPVAYNQFSPRMYRR